MGTAHCLTTAAVAHATYRERSKHRKVLITKPGEKNGRIWI